MKYDHSNKLKLAILGSGKGSNMVSIAEAIRKENLPIEIVIVIADVEGAGILDHAKEFGLPCRYIYPGNSKTRLDGESEQNYIRTLKESGAELVALAGFMRIIKADFLKAFDGKIINIHPSLLPSFPGLHAWEQALNYGVKYTGVTVHYVNSGIDSGKIIAQRVVPVMPDDTPATLHARIQVQEHEVYPHAIKEISGIL